MKKQKPVKESAKTKVDIKALKKLLKKIDLRSSVVSVIGLIVLVGALSSIYSYTTINPTGAQLPQPNVIPAEEPESPPYLPCRVSCHIDPGEIPITCGYGWQSNPTIYEDIMVWADGRDSDYGYNSIYLRDLSDPTYPRTGKKLTDNYKGEEVPDIYQKLIVWEDYRNGQLNTDIYMHNLDTGEETHITPAIKNQAYPKIDGNYIVWEDYRDDPTPLYNTVADLYAYDLQNPQEEIRLTNTPTISESQPKIWNNLTAYLSVDVSVTPHRIINEIMVIDLESRDIIMTFTTSGTPYALAIDAGKLVWMEQYLDPPYTYIYNIVVVDLLMGSISSLYSTPPPRSRSAIQIHNNNLVWADYRDNNGGQPEIYHYNLTTGVEQRLTDDPTAQVQPAIYGNRVVWTDYRNVYWQPYPICPTDTSIYMRIVD